MRILDRVQAQTLAVLAFIAIFLAAIVASPYLPYTTLHAQQVGPGGVPGAGGSGGAVSSVFGRTGAVVAASADYTCAEVTGCFTNPMTSEGDLIFGGTSGVATRLAGPGASAVLFESGGSTAPFWEATVSGSSGGIVRATNPQLTTVTTLTNCSSAVSPAACSAAPSGSVALATGGTTLVVDTTAVTANSQIQITFDSSLGTKLSVTCNTTIQQPTVSARTAGTSFTITVPTTISTNPDCISYTVIN